MKHKRLCTCRHYRGIVRMLEQSGPSTCLPALHKGGLSLFLMDTRVSYLIGFQPFNFQVSNTHNNSHRYRRGGLLETRWLQFIDNYTDNIGIYRLQHNRDTADFRLYTCKSMGGDGIVMPVHALTVTGIARCVLQAWGEITISSLSPVGKCSICFNSRAYHALQP